jgi:hypothetical protein
MDCLSKLNSIFSKIISYDFINKNNEIHLRNYKNGINLVDAIFYRFKYSQIRTTKETIASSINYKNDTSFYRQSYERKDSHISVNIYKMLLQEIILFFNSHCKKTQKDNLFLVAVDGVNNLSNKYEVMLNMGYFDVTNGVPIDITYNSHANRNKEVKCCKEYIDAHMDDFKNAILIGDRFYFTYKLLNYLNDNNLKFVIRVKGKGKNLKDFTNFRIVSCTNSHDKTFYNSKTKTTNTLTITDDYLLVTNLDKDKYSDKQILDFYRLRWDIEVFFKFIKSNFKFSHLLESDNVNHQKMYICELIISYLLKIFSNMYTTKNNINKTGTITKRKTNKKVECTIKINESNLLAGIYDELLNYILSGSLTDELFEKLMKYYVKIIKNETGRSFERVSKMPFSKWYIKKYSDKSKYQRILSAIVEGTVDKLDKNLKILANKVTAINKKPIKDLKRPP